MKEWPTEGIFAAEGGIHFCECCLQLHNTGLGFCADCLAEGDVLGCAMMLAPCSDSQQQQVGGQCSQTCKGSLLGWPSLPFGASPFSGPMSLDCAWSPTLTTHSPTCPSPKPKCGPIREYEHLNSRDMARLFSQCLHLTDEETEAWRVASPGASNSGVSPRFKWIKETNTGSWEEAVVTEERLPQPQ